MRNLHLGDLDIALKNLATERKADLDLSAAGKLYGPMLARRHESIQNLPEVLRKRPLVAELEATDDRHDGYGGAIFAYVEAILLLPIASDATRAAALRIREAFVPNRTGLTDSYAEEAATAMKNRPKLAELEADLKMFPAPDGKTLHDWVSGFLDAGDDLSTLLNERSLAGVSAPENGTKLRSETIKLLYQFRATLRTEMEENTALPRDLERRVFSYFDELNTRRKRSGKSKTEEPAEGSAPTGNPGG
ncbi:hypothetical protein [Polyangium sorediatum]|uniref:Uncharacterized protein n=1 Tax=Polyangium sorediatum TaxID=889274 RepID=A0ABT6NX27_9BACT|nr:hypothetical protein [Polyangium sorediatum]MDI1432896.1 hypothetical protein [Polyangium sorediatum]